MSPVIPSQANLTHEALWYAAFKFLFKWAYILGHQHVVAITDSFSESSSEVFPFPRARWHCGARFQV